MQIWRWATSHLSNAGVSKGCRCFAFAATTGFRRGGGGAVVDIIFALYVWCCELSFLDGFLAFGANHTWNDNESPKSFEGVDFTISDLNEVKVVVGANQSGLSG